MAVGLRKKKSYRCMTLSLTVFCSAHALFLWIILCLPESERDGLCFFFYFRRRSLSSQVAAELFHADGQTDRHDEANSRLPQFRERA